MPTIEELIERAQKATMTLEQREAERRGLGAPTEIELDAMTLAIVDRAAELMAASVA